MLFVVLSLHIPFLFLVRLLSNRVCPPCGSILFSLLGNVMLLRVLVQPFISLSNLAFDYGSEAFWDEGDWAELEFMNGRRDTGRRLPLVECAKLVPDMKFQV